MWPFKTYPKLLEVGVFFSSYLLILEGVNHLMAEIPDLNQNQNLFNCCKA